MDGYGVGEAAAAAAAVTPVAATALSGHAGRGTGLPLHGDHGTCSTTIWNNLTSGSQSQLANTSLTVLVMSR